MKLIKYFCAFLLLIFTCNSQVMADTSQNLPSAIGIVRELNSENIEENGTNMIHQTIDLELLTGQFKGEKRFVENTIGGNPYYDINLKKGDKVIVHLEPKDEFIVSADDVDFFITDIKRDNTLWLLAGIFSLFLIIIGRLKGLKSLLSIGVTVGFVFTILVPLILHEVSPIFATILVGIISTFATIYLVAGINKKSTSAILGTTASLLFAGIIALGTIKFARLTGFINENNVFLYSQRPDISMEGILASAIILSALGALMDVGVSIASTINELHITNPELTPKQLFTSGMNVGRDIIGTMSNTLILVYLGTSLPLILLSSNIDLQKFFNLNQVVTEISSALIGSIAILACVPLTALISSRFCSKSTEK